MEDTDATRDPKKMGNSAFAPKISLGHSYINTVWVGIIYSNSAVDRLLLLHDAPGVIPSTSYGPPSPTRSDPWAKSQEHSKVWLQNKTLKEFPIKQMNKETSY